MTRSPASSKACLRNGGEGIRTPDLVVMSHASYQAALPRVETLGREVPSERVHSDTNEAPDLKDSKTMRKGASRCGPTNGSLDLPNGSINLAFCLPSETNR
jgi:hypothetical protein